MAFTQENPAVLEYNHSGFQYIINNEYDLCFVLYWLVFNPRLVLEFDLLFYAFGKLGTVTVAWAIMFSYTLSVPYYTLLFWGSLYHKVPSKLGLSLGMGLILYLIQTCILGVFPIYVVVHHQLPPASRFIVILEQVSLFYFFIYCIFSVKSHFAFKCNRKERLLVMTCARNTLYHR